MLAIYNLQVKSGPIIKNVKDLKQQQQQSFVQLRQNVSHISYSLEFKGIENSTFWTFQFDYV